MAKSNLVLRLITAAVVLPLLLLLLFRGPVWGFYLLVVTVCAISALELFTMTHPRDAVAQGIGVVTTVGLSLIAYFFSSDARVLLTAFLMVAIVGILVPLWRLGEIATAALRVMAGVAGPLYIGVLLTTIALLHRDRGPEYVVLTLTIAWLGDTGGYFFGRFFGKTKLYEAVSPKKTRAGFVGSLIGSSVAALAAHFVYLQSIPLGHVLLLALVAGALGQMGDLVESLLKRSTGVKDSGRIVPGHGGLLDRIDAVLIVAPLVHLYSVWFVSS